MVNRLDDGSASAAPRIQALPEELVNQIAAGEVIERPASVVKELVENAIDAGATEVAIEVEGGGRRTIRISDDGVGIHADDLPLALASHATSKLRSKDDLFSIATLGFRGEALASIASVSELEIFTRVAGADAGSRIVCSAGVLTEKAPAARRVGTQVTVRGLFDAIPARKKFLKSDRAEVLRIKSTLFEIGLSEPSVGFRFVSDGRTVFAWESGQAEKVRAAEVLGQATADQLLELNGIDSPIISLHGWIGDPQLYRRTSEQIFVILNGRPIRDKTLTSALREGYRSFQIPGRFPVAVLYLHLDPREFDVNVHPTKREVRFHDSRSLFSTLYRAVERTLTQAGRIPTTLPTTRWDQAPQQIGEERARSGYPAAPPQTSDVTSPMRDQGRGSHEAAPEVSQVRPTWPENSQASAVPPGHEDDATSLPLSPDVGRVFQVGHRYLILEEAQGIRVIDQHALHEKIIYEELIEQREQGVATAQPLLIPETVTLTPAEAEVLSELEGELHALGFSVEEFGPDHIAIRSVPSGFDRVSPRELLVSILETGRKALRDRSRAPLRSEDLTHQLVETMACKRAVKAGQPLNEESQRALVESRSRAFRPQNCPHGRPTEVFLSWEELDRAFDRR